MSLISKTIFILILILPVTVILAQTTQADDQIYDFFTVQEKPVIRNDAQPDYPQAAIDAGIEGTVVVTVVINKNGTVADAEILNSIPQLDNAALSAARRKTFTPGAIDGSPVNTRMNIPIVFNLATVPAASLPEETESYTPSASGDVVDLTAEAVIIKAEPDRPRVNIISDRIKPEFDNINLEKSFAPELLGRAERIVIIPRTDENELQTIDINQILNRSR
jgi:TonB family protein